MVAAEAASFDDGRARLSYATPSWQRVHFAPFKTVHRSPAFRGGLSLYLSQYAALRFQLHEIPVPRENVNEQSRWPANPSPDLDGLFEASEHALLLLSVAAYQCG